MGLSKKIVILSATLASLKDEFSSRQKEMDELHMPLDVLLKIPKPQRKEINALEKKILALTPKAELIETLTQLNGIADGTIPTAWGPNPDLGSVWLQQSHIASELRRRKNIRVNIILISTAIISLLFFLKEFALFTLTAQSR